MMALAGYPLGLDFLAELVRACFLDQNLDARLVDIVAATVAVVYAQRCFQIGEQMLPRQEFIDHRADDGRAAEATADHHAKTNVAGC